MSDFVLNNEQQKAFDTVMSGVNCFITGGAGTGKTYLTKAFVSAMQDRGKNVMVVAPTGVAASAVGGVTIHRGFGLPATVCINEKTMTSKVRVSKPLSTADAVVIDEVSMVRMDLFDSIMASVRKAGSKAGKHIQVIAVGDFCQLPPILRNTHGERKLIETFYKRQIETPYAFLGNEWRNAGQLYVSLSRVRTVDGIYLENDIEPWNLVVDLVVKDFYNNLGKEDTAQDDAVIAELTVKKRKVKAPKPRKAETVKPAPIKPVKETNAVSEDISRPRREKKKKGTAPTPKGGRPQRFPSGATTMRVPNELAEHLQKAIQAIYPSPQDGNMDRDKADRLASVLKEFYTE